MSSFALTGQDPATVPPPPPPAPPLPGVGDVRVQVEGVTGDLLARPPQTARELRALEQRRSELSDQLISVTNRRGELVREMAGASGANLAGLEGRLQVLDARIVQLETDIATSGQLLAAAPANLAAQSSDVGGLNGGLENGQVTAIAIVGTMFIGFPLAIAMARLIWKRATAPAPRLPQETTQRLERMEHAVDAIAIEVERVSEGQRFLTRLFTESNGAAAALAAGQRAAEPLRVPEGDPVHVPSAGT